MLPDEIDTLRAQLLKAEENYRGQIEAVKRSNKNAGKWLLAYQNAFNAQLVAEAEVRALREAGEKVIARDTWVCTSEELAIVTRKAFDILRSTLAQREKVLCAACSERESVALEQMTAEITEYEQLAALQRQREQPWIERWRKETGKPDSLPDYGEMFGWIIAKADTAEVEIRTLREAATDAHLSAQASENLRRDANDRIVEMIDRALTAYDVAEAEVHALRETLTLVRTAASPEEEG